MILISTQGASMQKATFGGGCFWCIEAVFNKTKGVQSAISGYSGGTTKNPTYEQVCNGVGNHAEVVQVTYDSDIISYHTLLEIFFALHDATTLNRQGNDVGTQYRSVIYYHDEQQKEIAQKVIEAEQKKSSDKIVTELTELDIFYKAEEYHQNYFENNPNQGYCNFVIKPKVNKFETKFKELVK
jgi:peptide-methionine (S)-S-oxide reductase